MVYCIINSISPQLWIKLSLVPFQHSKYRFADLIIHFPWCVHSKCPGSVSVLLSVSAFAVAKNIVLLNIIVLYSNTNTIWFFLHTFSLFLVLEGRVLWMYMHLSLVDMLTYTCIEGRETSQCSDLLFYNLCTLGSFIYPILYMLANQGIPINWWSLYWSSEFRRNVLMCWQFHGYLEFKFMPSSLCSMQSSPLIYFSSCSYLL